MSKMMVTALTLLCAPLAMTAASDAQAATLHDQSGPYELQVLVDGSPAATYQQNGETYILGYRGARYTLRVQNHSSRRIEAVVSVDGRDVIDGRGADYQHKRGYLVDAYGTVDIDGWRLTAGQAAAFRFSSVANSYAGRTGSAREVGVIGVAVFPEREPYHVYVPRPQPRPYYGYRGRDDIYGTAPDAPPPPSASMKDKAERASSDEYRPAPSPASPPAGAMAGNGAMVEREKKSPSSRPGLGTGFGERVDSPIQEVPFSRQSSSSPSALLGVRYNDRTGLLAMGIDVDGDGTYYDGEAYRRRTATPFPNNSPRYASPPPGWEGGYSY